MTVGRPPVWRIAVALVVAAIWGIGAALPIGVDPLYSTPLSVLSDIWFSVMLVSYAGIAWFLAGSSPDRGVAIAAAFLGAAGIAGAVGNLLEDIFAVPGAENLYGVGFLGSLLAFVGIVTVLVARRRFVGALIGAATLGGVMVMAGHGPPVMPVLWSIVAAVAWRAPDRLFPRSSSP